VVKQNPVAAAEPAMRDHVSATTVSETVAAVTTTNVRERFLARQLEMLIRMARDERFEDGMDSNFSVGLRVLFRDHSIAFAHALDDRFKRAGIRPRVLAELAYTLGRIRDDATSDWRLAVLVDFLNSSTPSVRDAGAVGLAYLDDKRAVKYLREAIGREPVGSFREDLCAVLEQVAA